MSKKKLNIVKGTDAKGLPFVAYIVCTNKELADIQSHKIKNISNFTVYSVMGHDVPEGTTQQVIEYCRQKGLDVDLLGDESDAGYEN